MFMSGECSQFTCPFESVCYVHTEGFWMRSDRVNTVVFVQEYEREFSCDFIGQTFVHVVIMRVSPAVISSVCAGVFCSVLSPLRRRRSVWGISHVRRFSRYTLTVRWKLWDVLDALNPSVCAPAVPNPYHPCQRWVATACDRIRPLPRNSVGRKIRFWHMRNWYVEYIEYCFGWN